jgi:hypothetical protein
VRAYIYYISDDNAFERAAKTEAGVSVIDTNHQLLAVETKAEFISAWRQIKILRKNRMLRSTASHCFYIPANKMIREMAWNSPRWMERREICFAEFAPSGNTIR